MRVMRVFNHFILCFVFITISDTYGQREEGSACSKLGFVGKCQKVTDCQIALEALAVKGRHELDTCGFDGDDEIVCCPDLSTDIYRHQLNNLENTSVEGFILPDDGGSSKPPVSSTERPENKSKRKCDKMCKKIYDDNGIKPYIGKQIFNGQNAEEGQIPHMVALGFPNSDGDIEWNCGASLISTKFLLSAAHCFVCIACVEPKKARLGVIDINDGQSAQDVDVKNTISHPKYDPNTKLNDIALVELLRDVIMSNNIYPACLYTEDDDPIGLQIAGWGLTGTGRESKATMLQFATIDPVPITHCNETVLDKNKFSSKIILRTQICGTTRSDACKGDSGGPLQIAKPEGGYSLVGVVSYGPECGSKTQKTPGIYTRVVTYIDWIENQVWPES